MDNFVTWVDAPSEALIPTPIEDESNCVIRDEILQTQQFVIDKLDEHKNDGKDKEDRVSHEEDQAQDRAAKLMTEADRSEAVREALVELQKSCRNNDMRLISMKKNFPTADLPKESYEQELNSMRLEISSLVNNMSNREGELKKIEQNLEKVKSPEEKLLEIQKIRESILLARKKHENLANLAKNCRELQAKVDEAEVRQKTLSESITAGKATLLVEQEKHEKLKEQSAELRAEFVQIESMMSTDRSDADSEELTEIQKNTAKIQEDTVEIQENLELLKKSVAEEEQKQKDLEKEEKSMQKICDSKKSELLALLKKKIKEAKEKSKQDAVLREVHELKMAISKENAELDAAKQELEELKPKHLKSVDDMRREISLMESSMKSHDKKLKEAIRQNQKLTEEIAAMNPVNIEEEEEEEVEEIRKEDVSQSDITLDIPLAENMAQKFDAAPPPPVILIPQETPTRQISMDVFADQAPLMTSTPLIPSTRQHRGSDTPMPPSVEQSRLTRSRRRLERNAAAKTAAVAAAAKPTRKTRGRR